jgi:signal transduction histidine kinase
MTTIGLRRSAARFGSVRARATLAAVLVVGAAMAVGAIGLLALLRSSMREGVETTARSQLNNVGSLLRVGLPAQLPTGRGDTVTQVVGPNGAVLAASAGLDATRPISVAHPGEEGVVIHSLPASGGLADDDSSSSSGPFLLLAKTFTGTIPGSSASVPVTVYVAGSLHPVEEATTTVGLALAGGLPVLVALVGALVWTFGGRALRPVEAIRAEVSDISGHDLHRRVPEPPSGDEVARLARTMNEMLDRLEASAGAQRRFVADASHELRSPLAVLQATLEVALAHPNDASWKTVASDALDEVNRLHRLVEDLLVLAHADESDTTRRDEPVDLDELIVRESRRWRATSTSVPINLRGLSGGRVRGNPDQLARVVHNLLDNAQRHATSQVGVELSSGSDGVTMVVFDDGPGIPASDRERVFDRFTRLDEARGPDAGGTGLGLAIAREIVDAHDGSIEVADVDRGARLVVHLPAADEG